MGYITWIVNCETAKESVHSLDTIMGMIPIWSLIFCFENIFKCAVFWDRTLTCVGGTIHPIVICLKKNISQWDDDIWEPIRKRVCSWPDEFHASESWWIRLEVHWEALFQLLRQLELECSDRETERNLMITAKFNFLYREEMSHDFWVISWSLPLHWLW